MIYEVNINLYYKKQLKVTNKTKKSLERVLILSLSENRGLLLKYVYTARPEELSSFKWQSMFISQATLSRHHRRNFFKKREKLT